MSNDFIIEHQEPEKKHNTPIVNQVEVDSNSMLNTLIGMVEKSEMADYATSGQLSNFVDNILEFVDNIPASEFAQDTYCKQLQEVYNRIQSSVIEKLQEILDKINIRLGGLLSPFQALLETLNIVVNPPSSLEDVLNWAINVCKCFSNMITLVIRFINLITGLISEITNLLNTLSKIAQLPTKISRKISELGCNFTPPSTEK